MSATDENDRTDELVLEYDLDAPPEKVWRALRMPAFREKWLPDRVLADPDPIASVPGREVCYRMLDDEPPFFESLVVFRIVPGADEGTRLRIVHRLTDARLQPGLGPAANSNGSRLMRAA